MTTSHQDISIVLSGGSSNLNPNLSIGGDPSSNYVANNVLNNLFHDISAEEAGDGHEDYRCIYIFNDGDTPVWNVKVFTEQEETTSSTVELGIERRNESKRLLISSNVTGGSLELSIGGRPFEISYNSNLADWVLELQTALRNITISDASSEKLFDVVTVTGQTTTNGFIVFDILWSGKDSSRVIPEMTEVEDGNLLIPSGEVSVSLSVPRLGAPINTIAATILDETISPNSVQFQNAVSSNPITLLVLKPNDGFPLWIKRRVEAGADSKELDGVKILFVSNSLEPI